MKWRYRYASGNDTQECDSLSEARRLRAIDLGWYGSVGPIRRVLSHEESKRKFAAEELRSLAGRCGYFIGSTAVNELNRRADELWPEGE